MPDIALEQGAQSKPTSERRRLAKTPSRSPRIEKQPSTAALREEYIAMDKPESTALRSVSDARPQAPTLRPSRKGSIRDAVRRFFGRRPKTAGDYPRSASNPNFRHSHAASVSRQTTSNHMEQAHDPKLPGIGPTVTSQSGEDNEEVQTMPQRTLSAPLQPLRSNAPPRPPKQSYAVEFPQSARLKPLDLGNPFHKDPETPKRRATLPSLIMDEATLAKLAPGSQAKRDEPQETDVRAEGDAACNTYTLDLPSHALHRKSRSADDLQRMLHTIGSSQDRTSDIESWRQTSAASYFPPATERVQSTASTITRRPSHPLTATTPHSPGNALLRSDSRLSITPGLGPVLDPGHPANRFSVPTRSGTVNVRSTPTTSGLETRVSALETSLRAVEQKCNRLAGQVNHRTVIIDNSPRVANSSPSAALLTNLIDADNQLEGVAHSVSDDANQQVVHARSSHPSTGRTMAALYSMINEERQVRRALDEQVRALQASLAALQGTQPAISPPSDLPMPQRTLSTMSSPLLGRSTLPRTNNMLYREDSFRMSDSMADLAASSLSVARNLGSEDSTSIASGTYPSPAHRRRQDRHNQIMDDNMF